MQLIAFGFEFGITLTKGAVGFPGVLMFFAICAEWVWPLIIPREYLNALDSEVADEKIVKNLEVFSQIKEKQLASESDIEIAQLGPRSSDLDG